MELLRDIPGDGYPTDYVVARVRARRTALTHDWRAAGARRASLAASDEAIWDGLLQEFEWLYLQMDRPMRARLAPVFALFELKTIVLCLRNASAGRPDEIERLLGHSLLADRVRDALRAGPQIDLENEGVRAEMIDNAVRFIRAGLGRPQGKEGA